MLRYLLPLIVIIPSLMRADSSRGLNYSFPSIPYGNYIYLGTANGLLKYDLTQKEWIYLGMKSIGGNNVRLLGIDEGSLYVATENGLAVSNIRLNDWLVYKKELPELPIYDIAFSTDYVFIACSKGLAAWDKLGQSWKTILSNERINALLVIRDNLWMVGEKGIAVYSIKYERLTRYSEVSIPSWSYTNIVSSPSFIWFQADEGMVRYNKELKSFKGYASNKELPISEETLSFPDGDYLWLINKTPDTKGATLLRYDPNQDNFFSYEFMDRLPSKKVNAISISGTQKWFATDMGLTRYNENTKDWKDYTLTDGLSSNNVLQFFISGSLVFVVNEKGIDIGDIDKNQWKAYTWSSLISSSALSFLNMSVSKDGLIWKLRDKSDLQIRGTSTHYASGSKDEETTRDSKTAMNALLNIDGKRSVSGFYDDTDEDDVLWGTSYRGADRDIVKEAGYGDERMAAYQNKLLSPITINGGYANLQALYYDEPLSSSHLNLKAWAGERISARTRDYFKGKGIDHSVTVKDIDYLESVYRLSIDGSKPDEPEKLEVWLDDGNINNNIRSTKRLRIEGIEGYFDKLTPKTDYYYELPLNILVVQANVPSRGVLAVHYTYQGRDIWHILHTESRSGFLTNYYSSGGKKIIPYTLQVTIRDTLNNIVPLSRFGLDRNGDNRVDPDYIDYENGFLHFPIDRPFNPSCYDESNPISTYSIQFSYQTEVSIFSLSNKDLIQNSEYVYLDRLPLDRGTDYVVDYSTGSLLILDENLLSSNSLLEITYEFKRKTNLTLFAGELGIEPVSNLRMGSYYVRYRSRHLGSESIRYDLPVSDGSTIRIEPEMAVSKQDTLSPAYSGRTEVQFRSDILLIGVDYLRNTVKYENLDTLYNQSGVVKQRVETQGIFKPYSWLPFDINYIEELAWADSASYSSKVLKNRSLQAQVSEAKPSLPAFTLSGLYWWREELDEDLTINTAKTKASYDIPKSLLEGISINGITIEGFYKRNWVKEKFTDPDSIPDTRSLEDTWYAQLQLSPVPNFSSRFKFEEGRTNDDKASLPWHRSEFGRHVTTEAISDAFKGFYIKGSIEGEYNDDILGISPLSVEEERERKLKGELKFYPGQYFPSMNIITLILDLTHDEQGWVREDTYGHLTEIIFKNRDRRDYLSLSSPITYGIGTELTPLMQVSLSSRYEFGHRDEWLYQTESYTQLHYLINKLILKPFDATQITARLEDDWEIERYGPRDVTHSPWLSYQQRWSSLFLTTLGLNLSQENTSWDEVWEIKRNASTSLSLTINPGKHRLYGEVLFIPSVIIGKQTTWGIEGFDDTRTLILDANIDWSPLSFLTGRFYYTATYTRQDRQEGKWNYQFMMEGGVRF